MRSVSGCSDSSPRPSVELPARTHAAALSVEIRTPLAQIELAASQLFREALTPNAQARSEQIFEAVSAIDGLVDRMLRVLVPRSGECEPDQDLAPVVSGLRRRFAPALAACGVDWKWGEPDDERVIGNLEQVRRLCTDLLHLALNLSGEGGRFTLELANKEQAVEAALFCRRASALSDEQVAAAQSAIHQSQAFALERGGALSGTMDAVTSDLRLVIANDSEPVTTLPVEREAACQEF